MVTLHRLLYVTQLHFYYTILADCSLSQYCPAFFWLKARSFTLKLIGSLTKSLRLHRLLYLIIVWIERVELPTSRFQFECFTIQLYPVVVPHVGFAPTHSEENSFTDCPSSLTLAIRLLKI